MKPRDSASIVRDSIIKGTSLECAPGTYNFKYENIAVLVAKYHQNTQPSSRWHVAAEEDFTFTVLEERSPTKGAKHGNEA